MASKQPKEEVSENRPFADNKTNPELGREQTVEKAPSTTFDERTSVSQPFITADGKQDNGQKDLDAVDGAKGTAAREGNTTTVEETDKAIRKGKVEGTQNKAEL